MPNVFVNDVDAVANDKVIRWLFNAERSTPETIWRKEAMEDYRFYAGDQDPYEVKMNMTLLKRPNSTYNDIKQKIDMLVGLAAQTKHEPTVVPSGENGGPISQLMTSALKHFRKKMKMSRKELDAFEHKVKSGRSLLHFWVNTNNPFEPQIMCKRFPGRHFYIDPESQELDLSDARFIILENWLTKDEIKQRWPNFDISQYQSFTHTGNADLPTFFNESREKYRLCECWWYEMVEMSYFVNPITGKVEMLPPADFKLFAKACKEGIPLGPNGEKKQFPVPQMSFGYKQQYYYRIFSGNMTVEEGKSPYKFDRFPSVLYGAYKNEDTNTWFSVTNQMKDPQRAQNVMHRQLTHLLQTLPKGLMMHETGAILDIASYEKRSSDPSFHLEVGVNKLDKVKFQQQPQISPLYQMLITTYKQQMKDTGGMQNELMGQETSSRTPGVTVKSRQETGIAVLYTLYDNYSFSRFLGNTILMNLIQQYVSQPVLMRIEGPDGMELMEANTRLNPEHPEFNDLTLGDYEIDLDEILETSSTRAAVADRLMEYSHNNPGAVPADLILEYSDVPYSLKQKVRAATAAQAQAAQLEKDRLYELELLKIQEKVDATNADKVISEREMEIQKNLKQAQAQSRGGQ